MDILDVKEVKLVLVGDTGVGKSCIVHRYCNDSFNVQLQPTIGAAYQTKDVSVDHRTIRYKIWDTAGQEKFRAILPMYFRGAHAAVVVYDITRMATFNSLQYWLRELKTDETEDVIFAIAGNKCDLTDKREVSYNEAMNFAEKCDALFVETSALTGANIQTLFYELTQRLALKFAPGAPKSPRKATVQLHKDLQHPMEGEQQRSHEKRRCCLR